MYALRPGLSFCAIEQTALFLDVPGDRYFALSEDLSLHFLSVVDAIRSGAQVNPTLARSLVARGILVGEAADRSWPTPALDHPKREWKGSLGLSGSQARHVWLALVCIVMTLFRLRLRPLHSIVDDNAAVPCRTDQMGALPDRAVSAFLLALRVWPWKLECLPMSVALRTFLAWHSVDADLVVAVKLNPFAAHCWVQVGDVVIGDTIDRVRAFTPIRSSR